ncbi:MAG TPA: hypothetical protein VJ112_01370 [Rhabdochlamydiaceae bacterium]|nr:hypothetical protein [Rhabdochlamydiaceae bacterium]
MLKVKKLRKPKLFQINGATTALKPYRVRRPNQSLLQSISILSDCQNKATIKDGNKVLFEMYICTGEAAKEVNLPIPLKVTTKLSITSIKEARFTMQFIKFEKTKRRSGVFQRQTPFKPTKLVMDINFYEELEKSLIEYSRQRA